MRGKLLRTCGQKGWGWRAAVVAAAPARCPLPSYALPCPACTPCPRRLPLEDPARFRVEVLFSPGAAYDPTCVTPAKKDHVLPVAPRVPLHPEGARRIRGSLAWG